MDLKPFSKEEAMSINQNVFGIFAEAVEDLSKINGQWVYEDIVFNEYNFKGKEQSFAMTDLKFNCSFHSQVGDSIFLKLKFYDNIKVSQSIYGKDKLHFMIYANSLIVDGVNEQTLDESSLEESHMI